LGCIHYQEGILEKLSLVRIFNLSEVFVSKFGGFSSTWCAHQIPFLDKKWFINFFNTTQAITPRMHALELIPGIGKKYMWQILDERDRKPFQNLEDLQERANMPNPSKLITRRILEELGGDSKYRLFTRAP